MSTITILVYFGIPSALTALVSWMGGKKGLYVVTCFTPLWVIGLMVTNVTEAQRAPDYNGNPDFDLIFFAAVRNMTLAVGLACLLTFLTMIIAKHVFHKDKDKGMD